MPWVAWGILYSIFKMHLQRLKNILRLCHIRWLNARDIVRTVWQFSVQNPFSSLYLQNLGWIIDLSAPTRILYSPHTLRQTQQRGGPLPFSHLFALFFFTFYFILEYSWLLYSWLLYNVVIVSGDQQRDSVIHIYASILPQTPLPSRLHITLSRFPCAIQ